MLMIASDSCGCRGCGLRINKGEKMSWATGGPYHLACTPLSEDWTAIEALNHSEQPPSDSKRKPWAKSDMVLIAVVATAPILVILIAMLPGHPYAYFVFLRWVVCPAVGILAMLFLANDLARWAFGFFFIALLYNPILPVHLTRSIWIILNIATIVAIAAGTGRLAINEYQLRRIATKAKG